MSFLNYDNNSNKNIKIYLTKNTLTNFIIYKYTSKNISPYLYPYYNSK